MDTETETATVPKARTATEFGLLSVCIGRVEREISEEIGEEILIEHIIAGKERVKIFGKKDGVEPGSPSTKRRYVFAAPGIDDAAQSHYFSHDLHVFRTESERDIAFAFASEVVEQLIESRGGIDAICEFWELDKKDIACYRASYPKLQRVAVVFKKP